ncbi:hypothetical protein TTMY_0082 [Thermus thermophilus]|nr:hypothetical protein TTMY_0082 [Thermus thermophilus]
MEGLEVHPPEEVRRGEGQEGDDSPVPQGEEDAVKGRGPHPGEPVHRRQVVRVHAVAHPQGHGQELEARHGAPAFFGEKRAWDRYPLLFITASFRPCSGAGEARTGAGIRASGQDARPVALGRLPLRHSAGLSPVFPLLRPRTSGPWGTPAALACVLPGRFLPVKGEAGEHPPGPVHRHRAPRGHEAVLPQGPEHRPHHPPVGEEDRRGFKPLQEAEDPLLKGGEALSSRGWKPWKRRRASL